MGNILVNDNAVDEFRIFQGPSRLALHTNHVKVYILMIQVRHPQHSIHRDLCHFTFALVDDFGAQSRHRRRNQRLDVVLRKFHPVGDGIQLFDSHVRRLLVPLGDANGMDAPGQQLLRLLQQRPGEDHDACRAVADFVVLGGGQLHHKFGHLVIHVHALEDRRSVIGDGDVSVGGDEDFVHPLRTEGRAKDFGDGCCGQDIRLHGF
mmetsp:Transcript_25818/g.54923  ORF Transcript_25818/g.54923 Transcript_25818/m.54923 type:complete len:206 (-) Transcript_25818:238-855(-)